MARDFEVHGADQLAALSRRMKEAGAGDLRKEMTKAFRTAAKPIIPATRAEARRRLPNRGGLAARVARAPQRVQVRTGNKPGVRVVVGGKGLAARTTEQGYVRHRVFGRGPWVRQAVRPGWFSEPAEGQMPAARREVQSVLKDYTKRLARESTGR